MKIPADHTLWSIQPDVMSIIAGLGAGQLTEQQARVRAAGRFGRTSSAGLGAGELTEQQSGVPAAGRFGDFMDGESELETVGGVAILSLRGVITPSPSFYDWLFGGSGGLQAFRRSLRLALEDETVSAIAIHVDSPGGRLDLVPETAAELRAARGLGKPIVAIANTMAASAAYWIAVQADELVVTPSGTVGSVGNYIHHVEFSRLDEELGITHTWIQAGQYKTEGNDTEPLSDEAREEMQRWVDETQTLFVADVAAGRGVSTQTVAQTYGEGRLVRPAQALALGMVDRVETFEAVVERLRIQADRPGTVGSRARAEAEAEAPAVEAEAEPPAADIEEPNSPAAIAAEEQRRAERAELLDAELLDLELGV